MKASFPLSINVVAHSSSENRFESAAGWKGVAAKGDSLGIVICAIGNTHLLLTVCLHCQPQTHLLLCKAKFDTENFIWREGPYGFSSVCLSVRPSGFSSKCNHTCLSTPVSWSGCRELLPGLGCGSACKSAVFSYSKWELWTDGLKHVGLSWREAAGKLCIVFPWSGLVWLGLVWSVPACCDHISGAHRPSWGNEQIQLTQQHLVLVMITKHTHMQTHYSVPIT